MNRRESLAFLGAAALPTLSLAASPSLVRILVPFPAGGAFDVIGRPLANGLQQELDATVILDFKPGATGRLAVDLLLQAPPDGATLMLHAGTVQSLYTHTIKKLNYAPFGDLAPVSLVAKTEFGFAVSNGVPASVKSIKDYLTWAAADPKRCNFGTPGAGTPYHFIPVLFARDAGVELNAIHYKGGNPAVQDLMADHVSAACLPLGTLLDGAANGRFRVIASTAAARTPSAPNVATFAEQGLPQYTREEWYAIFAHAKTPPAVMTRFSDAIQKVVATPAFRDVVSKHHFRPASASPEAALQLARADHAYWGDIVKRFGYEPE
ncbi:tripartite tricarboxylate transporter substrate-binding protein [Hydrogenophaga sp.]|uniref:tripartite tricarboxylate transporter substrate-binding protein n=1 Tax=Hydrogenophaga sp. TaxID=1904254 RepID=UPI0027217E7D|nr:tripartite tricarboxylate transporter substrate-binding protein [Hydrogenophaga sp.]MDO9435975.1 tripartite tricarboxylate transporter substrate-binding protein [Hydrogenophaga sp.]